MDAAEAGLVSRSAGVKLRFLWDSRSLFDFRGPGFPVSVSGAQEWPGFCGLRCGVSAKGHLAFGVTGGRPGPGEMHYRSRKYCDQGLLFCSALLCHTML